MRRGLENGGAEVVADGKIFLSPEVWTEAYLRAAEAGGELPKVFAHELGHLLLHRHGGPKGRGAVDEANKFPMSFLMPESDVLAVIPRVHTLNQIVRAKRRWAVSVMALLYRLAKLEVLSDWQYRRLCIQATRHGYRETEPYSVKREQSILWHKVLTALWKERTTKNDIAAALHISPREIENLLFGIAPLLSIEGNGTGKIKGNAPPLRLVN